MTVPGLLELQSDGNDVENNIAFLNHTVVGGKGADYLQAGSDPCTLLGEQGNDILIGRDSGDYISGGLGHGRRQGRSRSTAGARCTRPISFCEQKSLGRSIRPHGRAAPGTEKVR